MQRVLPARRRRWSADTLETSCRCDVKEFSGGGQTAQTVQMIQTRTRSKVQNVMKPDLEQTSLRREMEYEKLHTAFSRSNNRSSKCKGKDVSASSGGLIQQKDELAQFIDNRKEQQQGVYRRRKRRIRIFSQRSQTTERDEDQ